MGDFGGQARFYQEKNEVKLKISLFEIRREPRVFLVIGMDISR
jgi:hypothetical protein